MKANAEVPAEGEASAELRGRRKAAAFLLALDADSAAAVMRNLNESEVAALSEEMTRMGDLSGKDMEAVLRDFEDGSQHISVEPMLEALLEKALGADKAKSLLDRIRRKTRDREPFRSLRRLKAQQLELILRGEHPQVLALVIAYLEAPVAYEILRNMKDDLRYEVVRRIAATDETPFDMIRQVEVILEARAIEASNQNSGTNDRNRFQTIAQVLNQAEPGMTKGILEKLQKDLPSAAEQIQAMMFVFEDLVQVGDKDMQKVLGELDKADLALALKTATDEVKAKLLDNLSKRARDALLEEIEVLGPRPLAEVEEAQKRIVEVVRGMEERGEIRINRGGEELV